MIDYGDAVVGGFGECPQDDSCVSVNYNRRLTLKGMVLRNMGELGVEWQVLKRNLEIDC